MLDSIRSADERRREIQEKAAAMGIDETYISLLVDTFYERVRAHPLLAPIFDEAIKDDWAPHLAKMKAFWASVALNAGRYSGKPVPAHQKLARVRPWHFEIWLALFRQTLEDTAPSPAAVRYFQERAERIAQSLKLAMFGAPELAAAEASKTPPETTTCYAETEVFTQETAPDKLRSLHQTKPDVWGELLVLEGALDYVIPGPPLREQRINAGGHGVIEPAVPHFVRLTRNVKFKIRFYR